MFQQIKAIERTQTELSASYAHHGNGELQLREWRKITIKNRTEFITLYALTHTFSAAVDADLHSGKQSRLEDPRKLCLDEAL
jgi:hypothetical protein